MVTNVQAEEFSPQNVLAQVNTPMYLTDPMNMAPATSDDEPQNPSENGEPTSSGNPEVNTQDQHNWEKRYSDLRSYTDRQISTLTNQLSDLKTQKDTLATKLTEAQVNKIKPPKTPEEFKQFKEQYPDLVAFIETAVILSAESRETVISDRIKRVEEATEQNKAERGWQELKKFHPDADTLGNDPQFQAWFSAQDNEVKALIRSSNPKTISRGIDMYKEEFKIRTPARKAEEQRNNSRVPQANQRVEIESGGKRIYTEREIDKMPEGEFLKLLPDIKAAQYEGRIRKA